MKVEFLINEELNDGRQILITESEFRKAKNNEDEFNSFAFATHCLFSYYGADEIIDRSEYEKILGKVEKGGAVIITIVEVGYRKLYPEVYVCNNNRIKRIDLSE